MTREELNKALGGICTADEITERERKIWNCAMKYADEHPKNPWHKTPFNTPDKEAGRFEGEKYIVSVNGEIHKATYEGYGCWTLENGKTETENKFTEVYWMSVPELPK